MLACYPKMMEWRKDGKPTTDLGELDSTCLMMRSKMILPKLKVRLAAIQQKRLGSQLCNVQKVSSQWDEYDVKKSTCSVDFVASDGGDKFNSRWFGRFSVIILRPKSFVEDLGVKSTCHPRTYICPYFGLSHLLQLCQSDAYNTSPNCLTKARMLVIGLRKCAYSSSSTIFASKKLLEW